MLNDVSVILEQSSRDEARYTGQPSRNPDYTALNASPDELNAIAGEASLFSEDVGVLG